MWWFTKSDNLDDVADELSRIRNAYNYDRLITESYYLALLNKADELAYKRDKQKNPDKILILKRTIRIFKKIN